MDVTQVPACALQHTLFIPAHVSSLEYTQNRTLILGSGESCRAHVRNRLRLTLEDDGSIRLYRLPDTKVVKAIRGLGSEVSSIAVLAPKSGGFGDVWVACGSSVKLFSLDTQQLIQSSENALVTVQVCENDGDAVNGISVSQNQKSLAFTLDSGAVGVVDLLTNNIQRMKTQHTSICATVSFIPDRPSEAVSGGYDSALFHFDIRQGTLLSRRKFASSPQTSAVSLSPPFVLCLSVSPTGTIAAGTADGQIWIGLGGDKSVVIKKTRRWGGLRENMGFSKKIADGPIVASAFLNPATIVTSTLLGNISGHLLRIGGDVEDWRIESYPIAQTEIISKVNALVIHCDNIVVGGFQMDGKGVAEVYCCKAA
ncbi:WD40-repeat-containing domain protein [Lactarius psammicola]|nr:WD40-repeat-containing domain protein [Lactarius psammicola]